MKLHEFDHLRFDLVLFHSMTEKRMGENQSDKPNPFDFQEVLGSVPNLKILIEQIKEETERNGLEYSQESLVTLFSLMNDVIKRDAWVKWLNSKILAFKGKKPCDLIVTGRIGEVENSLRALAEGVFR